MLEPLKNAPFPADAIPAAAQKPTGSDAPKPLKMMAASGALPIPPEALLYVWYQLSFDADQDIRNTVRDTVNTFDNDLIAEHAAKDYPKSLLDWLANTSKNAKVLENIVLNSSTADETIMTLAADAPKDIVDIIANNHVRILRSPDIVEKIYLNPSARMATVDRLLNLLAEHHIEVPGLKHIQDARNSDEFKNDVPGLSDEEFEQAARESAEESKNEKPDSADNLLHPKPLDDDSAPHDEHDSKKLTHTQLVERMNAPQRMRLAMVGSREDRNILIRDARRVVYMSVIRSPKMTISEVGSIAASKSIPDEIIGYICTRRDWVRYYSIVVSLVNNPKCPLSSSVGFLRQLRPNDLKLLQKSKSVPAQLARQAMVISREKH